MYSEMSWLPVLCSQGTHILTVEGRGQLSSWPTGCRPSQSLGKQQGGQFGAGADGVTKRCVREPPQIDSLKADRPLLCRCITAVTACECTC